MEISNQKIFEVLCTVRKNPKSLIPVIEQDLKNFIGDNRYKHNGVTIMCNEGKKAWLEAISFLKKQDPLPAFNWSEGLSRACQDHCKDLQKNGFTGHNGTDGSSFSDRIQRYCEWEGNIGQNIDFGSDSAERVVTSLIIDDGVSSRGHRANIFNKAYLFVGLAAGRHPGYNTCCVMDFAHGVKEGKSSSSGEHGHSSSGAGGGYKKVYQPKYEEHSSHHQGSKYSSSSSSGHYDPWKMDSQFKGGFFQKGVKLNFQGSGGGGGGKTMVSKKSSTTTKTMNGKIVKRIVTTKIKYSNGDQQQTVEEFDS